MRVQRMLTALSLVVSLGCGGRESEPPPALRVAAASDLALAFEAMGREFQQRTGKQAVFSFGSSGQLTKQLREGAPFDVFASASTSFVDEVIQAGVCDRRTRAVHARGRIAVWTGPSAGFVPTSLDDLTDPRIGKIAIAQPEHAPYGRAAREALMQAGLWQELSPKIVYGENVRQALQFAQTGNAGAALTALSLVVVGEREGHFFTIDERLHNPLNQAIVVCKRGANRVAGEAFAELVNSSTGHAIMARYGFVAPDQALGQK